MSSGTGLWLSDPPSVLCEWPHGFVCNCWFILCALWLASQIAVCTLF